MQTKSLKAKTDKAVIIRKYVIFFITSKYSLLCNEWDIIEKVLFCSTDDGLTITTLKLPYIGLAFKLFK